MLVDYPDGKKLPGRSKPKWKVNNKVDVKGNVSLLIVHGFRICKLVDFVNTVMNLWLL
jgi:hypothetical protein